MKLYSYKIARDYGFAPNPFFGICTLGTCKPDIRERAQVGDLIVGCGALTHSHAQRVIFAMIVARKITFQEYWNDPQFNRKKPVFDSSWARAYGDNIYHTDNNKDWLQQDSHHSFDNGCTNYDNMLRDLKSQYVLIGREFSYFGNNSIEIPDDIGTDTNENLYANCRNYRNRFSTEFISAISEWFNGLPKGRIGLPCDWRH